MEGDEIHRRSLAAVREHEEQQLRAEDKARREEAARAARRQAYKEEDEKKKAKRNKDWDNLSWNVWKSVSNTNIFILQCNSEQL